MTRSERRKVLDAWKAAIGAFRADYPDVSRPIAEEWAWKKFEKVVSRVDVSDPRFDVETPDVARLYLLEAHQDFQRIAGGAS